jgi:hypothetical protein
LHVLYGYKGKSFPLKQHTDGTSSIRAMIRVSKQPAAAAAPSVPAPTAAYAAVSAQPAARPTAELWHARLGHPSYEVMAKMVTNQSVKGMKLTATDCRAAGTSVCSTCAQAKSHRQPHKPSETVYTDPLECISSDLCGPFSTASIHGERQFLTVVDHATDFSIITPLKSKADTTAAVKAAILWFENQTSRTVKAFRSDNGKVICQQRAAVLPGVQGRRHTAHCPLQPRE